VKNANGTTVTLQSAMASGKELPHSLLLLIGEDHLISIVFDASLQLLVAVSSR